MGKMLQQWKSVYEVSTKSNKRTCFIKDTRFFVYLSDTETLYISDRSGVFYEESKDSVQSNIVVLANADGFTRSFRVTKEGDPRYFSKGRYVSGLTGADVKVSEIVALIDNSLKDRKQRQELANLRKQEALLESKLEAVRKKISERNVNV